MRSQAKIPKQQPFSSSGHSKEQSLSPQDRLASAFKSALQNTSKAVTERFMHEFLPSISAVLEKTFGQNSGEALIAVLLLKKPENPRAHFPKPKNESWEIIAKETEECCRQLGINREAKLGDALARHPLNFERKKLPGGNQLAFERQCKLLDGQNATMRVWGDAPFIMSFYDPQGELLLDFEGRLSQDAQLQLQATEETIRRYLPKASEFVSSIRYRILYQ